MRSCTNVDAFSKVRHTSTGFPKRCDRILISVKDIFKTHLREACIMMILCDTEIRTYVLLKKGQTEFSETPNPAYFYAYFCFCTRKISFRGFSFTLYCHRTSKLNFKDVPRTFKISFVRRNRYPRCPKIVKKPAHF